MFGNWFTVMLVSFLYTQMAFTEDQLVSRTDPIVQFQAWYQEAAQVLPKPEAMTLSTCGKDARPSSRMVVLAGCDKNGMKFFTDERSKKGQEMKENPYVSAVFYWRMSATVERQVRIAGRVEQLPQEEVEVFLRKLPKANILTLLSVCQDEVISSRAELDQRYAAVQAKYGSTEQEALPVPEFWKGYKIVPDMFEFMQSASNWLGDRLVFLLKDDKWALERLAA